MTLPWPFGVLSLILSLAVVNTALCSQTPLRPPRGYGAEHASSSPIAHKSDFESLYSSPASRDDLFVWEPESEEDIPELSALSDEHFTRVGHPLFPEHSVRIKKAKRWCDPSVEYVSLVYFAPWSLTSNLVPLPDTSTLGPSTSSSTTLSHVRLQMT